MNVNFVTIERRRAGGRRRRRSPGGAAARRRRPEMGASKTAEALRDDGRHPRLRRLQRVRPRLQGGERRPRRLLPRLDRRGGPGRVPEAGAEIRSERCNHCADAPCVKNCPTGASHVNEGGVVLVTHGKCSGCKACIAACPYDARFVHPNGIRRQVHVLPPPRPEGPPARLRRRLPDRDPHVRRRERPGVGRRQAPARAAVEGEPPRVGRRSERPLPRMRPSR